jgi:hypothetical protein
MIAFRRLATLALFSLCSALPARADWTGTYKLHNEPPGRGRDADQQGNISAHGTKLRIDAEGPMGKMAMVTDFKAHKGLMIMDARHAFMTVDQDKAQGHGPFASIHCDSEESAACLAQVGFTKSGVETVNGKKSDRWEHDFTNAQGAKVHETLWVPQGVKGFAVVKEVSKSADKTTTFDVLDFKEGSVPAEQFEVPAGYTDMSSRMGPMGPMGPPGAHP